MLHSINYCMCVFLKFICIYFFQYQRAMCQKTLNWVNHVYLPSQNKEHCIVLYCIRLHSSSNIVGAMHAHHTWSPWSLQSLMGCILPTMHCRSNTVGSCCICVDATANTDATTPNIVGLLGVVDVHQMYSQRIKENIMQGIIARF